MLPAVTTLEVLQRYAEAWQRGDVAVLVGSYHDDVVLHWFGHNPLAGEHRGKAAALAALADLQKRVSRRLVAVDDVLASADGGVLLVRERFERDGRVGELARALVYRVRDEKLAECWVYDRDQRDVDEWLA